MTVLTAAQDATIELNQQGQAAVSPTSLFSTTSPFSRELALQARRAACDIVEAYDWQRMKLLATLTGDGSKVGFDLPVDYNRMQKDAKIHSSSFKTATFHAVTSEDEWLYITDNAISGTPGNWIILSGQMQIFPAMATGETARFYYVSNNIVKAADNTMKTAFTADTDTFVLSEKLLSLGIVWRWLSMKRLEYAEAMANYETALAQEIAKDKGSKVLTVGRQRAPVDTTYAYPNMLGQ